MRASSDGLPILYSFRRCPYAIRARLALRYASVHVVVREVVLRDKPQALRDISSKATVPVLELPDGSVLEQSLSIMEWALEHADPDGWLEAGDPTQGRALIACNDGPFKLLLDKYKYPHRQPTGCEPGRALHLQQQYRTQAVELLLRPLEEQLSLRPYLLGERPALADMAIMPFVRQFRGVDEGWFDGAPLPALRRWLAGLVSSPLFESVMGKLNPWKPGDPDTLF